MEQHKLHTTATTSTMPISYIKVYRYLHRFYHKFVCTVYCILLYATSRFFKNKS